MQAKYEATVAKFEIEKVIKEKREFDEGVAEATRMFDERAKQTKDQFDEFERLKGEAE